MLVSSPSDMAKVLICDECISLCTDVVKESYGQKGITTQLPDWRAESIKLKQEVAALRARFGVEPDAEAER